MKCTHLGIGAHQDDLEIMAFHGIVSCFRRKNRSFVGVTCTNGSENPRTRAIRQKEQQRAARIGKYGKMIQFDYPSRSVKRKLNQKLVKDLARTLMLYQPQVVYTHNLADRHDTHIGIAHAVVAAIRSLPKSKRPNKVYGCEVWRDLDWLPSPYRVELDVSGYDFLARKLLAVYKSQIKEKRYELAAMGRRQANATFAREREPDKASQIILAMDLTPLCRNQRISTQKYLDEMLRKFKKELLSEVKF